MEKKTLKKVLSIIGNVIIWLFVIFSLIITVCTIAAQSSEDGIPAIGNTTILIVESDSMSDTFEEGDVILGKKLSSEEQKSLKKDDIITFKSDLDGDGKDELNSHRIFKEPVKEGNTVTYFTRGDNEKKRLAAGDTTEIVDSSEVICKYTHVRLAGAGKVLKFLQTKTGFLVCIVLPLVALFIYEGFRFVKKYLEIKGAGKVSAEDEERIRKEAVEEYLRSKEGENVEPSGEAEASDEPAAEPEDNASKDGGEE